MTRLGTDVELPANTCGPSRQHPATGVPVSDTCTSECAAAADADLRIAAAYSAPEGNILNSVTWSNVQTEMLRNEPTRDQAIIQDIKQARSDDRMALRYSLSFQELIRSLPEDVQVKIQEILQRPPDKGS